VKTPAMPPAPRRRSYCRKLADDLRCLAGSPAYAEYRAICGWLDEYGADRFAKEILGPSPDRS
jgi:hypothetical protein